MADTGSEPWGAAAALAWSSCSGESLGWLLSMRRIWALVIRCGVHFFWNAGDGVAPGPGSPPPPRMPPLRVPLLLPPKEPEGGAEGVFAGGGMPLLPEDDPPPPVFDAGVVEGGGIEGWEAGMGDREEGCREEEAWEDDDALKASLDDVDESPEGHESSIFEGCRPDGAPDPEAKMRGSGTVRVSQRNGGVRRGEGRGAIDFNRPSPCGWFSMRTQFVGSLWAWAGRRVADAAARFAKGSGLRGRGRKSGAERGGDGRGSGLTLVEKAERRAHGDFVSLASAFGQLIQKFEIGGGRFFPFKTA